MRRGQGFQSSARLESGHHPPWPPFARSGNGAGSARGWSADDLANGGAMMGRSARGWNPDHFPLREWPAFWPGSYRAFNVIGPGPRGRKRALFTVRRFWRNAENNQVCPMSGRRFRQLDAFLISFWNKEIGTKYSVLVGQTALLRRSSLVQ
jgi:hypothetical protein